MGRTSESGEFLAKFASPRLNQGMASIDGHPVSRQSDGDCSRGQIDQSVVCAMHCTQLLSPSIGIELQQNATKNVLGTRSTHSLPARMDSRSATPTPIVSGGGAGEAQPPPRLICWPAGGTGQHITAKAAIFVVLRHVSSSPLATFRGSELHGRVAGHPTDFLQWESFLLVASGEVLRPFSCSGRFGQVSTDRSLCLNPCTYLYYEDTCL